MTPAYHEDAKDGERCNAASERDAPLTEEDFAVAKNDMPEKLAESIAAPSTEPVVQCPDGSWSKNQRRRCRLPMGHQGEHQYLVVGKWPRKPGEDTVALHD